MRQRLPFDRARHRCQLKRGRRQAERAAGEQAVKGFGHARSGAKLGLDAFRLAPGGVRPRRPEQARRPHFIIARLGDDRVERQARRCIILLPPRCETRHPVGRHGPFARAMLGVGRDAPGVAVVAVQVIGPGDTLLPFGARLGGEVGLPRGQQPLRRRRVYPV